MTISEQLRAARHLRGLSQAELAERIGVTAATVSHAERPGAAHSITTLRKFAEALDCSLYVGIVPSINADNLWDMAAIEMQRSYKQ